MIGRPCEKKARALRVQGKPEGVYVCVWGDRISPIPIQEADVLLWPSNSGKSTETGLKSRDSSLTRCTVNGILYAGPV